MSKRDSEGKLEDLFAPLDKIFSKVGESVAVVDRDRKVVFANDAAARIYREPSRDALVGMTIDEIATHFDVFDEKGRQLSSDQFPGSMALAGKEKWEAVVRYLDKRDGATGWALLRSGPILGPDGEVQFAVSVARDITQEREAFEEQKLQRALLSAAMEATVDGMLAVSPERKVLWFNQRFVEIWDIPDAVLESRDDAHLLSSVSERLSSPGAYFRKVEELYSRPDHREMEEVKLKDGRTLERYTAPLRGEDGALHGRLWLFRDITVRKEAERQGWMLAQEHAARVAAERASREAEFLAEVTRVTQTSLVAEIIAQRVTALSAEFFGGWCAIDFESASGEVHRTVASSGEGRALADELQRIPPDPVQFHRQLERLPEAGVIGNERDLPGWVREGEARRIVRELGLKKFFTVRVATPRQSLALLTLASSQEGTFDAEARSLAEELARRVAMGIENARLYAEARIAVRARNDFLSIASHELKTPIAALLLTAQVVVKRGKKEGPPLPAWVLDKLVLIERQCHRLNELVKRLLDVSMAISGRLDLSPEESDLVEIVRDVLVSYAVEIANSGSTVTVTADEPVTGTWDRARMEQLVQNLVSNAVKYGQGNPIDLEVHKEGDHAVLVVEDRGIGIPQEARGRLFQRFERAVSDHHFGGLGLGLYIVKQIVEGHGGTISLVSAPGEGSRFTVKVPLQGDVARRGPVESHRSEAPAAAPS